MENIILFSSCARHYEGVDTIQVSLQRRHLTVSLRRGKLDEAEAVAPLCSNLTVEVAAMLLLYLSMGVGFWFGTGDHCTHAYNGILFPKDRTKR